jgi:hypothetical protein
MKVFPAAALQAMRQVSLALSCVAWLSGCATLVSDDHQSIVVTSDPVGATCQVRQGGNFVGTVVSTPGTVFVGKSRHDIAIDCTRPGYFPGAAVLEPRFQDWTFGNILYGGSIGLLVDTSSGAINEYPHWVSVMMKRRGPRVEPLVDVGRPSELQAERERLLAEQFLRR